jgi:large subunit ribosomal protein L5
MNLPYLYRRRIDLAEEKAAPPAEKKVATDKKVAKAKVPSVDKKAVTADKAVKTEGQPAEKKPVAKKKVAEAKTPSAKKKPVAEEKAEPKAAKQTSGEWTKNPMLKPRIEKVTVNMSVGKSGAPLEQAATILQQLTNQKPSRRQAKKTVREFGIRKGESIACVVTLRKEKAEQFLRKALQAVDNKLSKYCFDRQGNFSFGIKEHIDIPGTKYQPRLGIHGMDVSVSLGRAGYRVKRRHRVKSTVGKDHLLTADEAILFIKDEFDVEIK